MSTKSLLIRDAVVALLKASPCGGVPDIRVFTDISHVLETELLPVILVDLGDEQAHRSVIGRMTHSVQIMVSVISAATKGVGAADAATHADPIIAEIHRRLVADTSLGGIAFDLICTATTRHRDELDRPVLVTKLIYDVQYKTIETSLEA